jgi:hypothetical protein
LRAFELQLADRGRIEQLAQLLLTQQLAQPLAVERERLGAALRHRRIAFVHELGDVVEQQRAGKRRGGGRLDRRQTNAALLNAAQHLL